MPETLMFTAREYSEHMPRLLGLPLVACEYWELGHEDFGGSSEELACVARAGDHGFESALHFFVNTLRFVNNGVFLLGNGRDDPESEPLAAYTRAKISPLPQDQFTRLNVPATWGVRTWPFHSSVRFLEGQIVEADWNDVATIARFEGAFAAVFWSTSA